MQSYKKLYFHLFNQFTELIEKMKTIQQEAEELYLELHELEDTEE